MVTYFATSWNMLEVGFGATPGLDIAEVHLLIQNLDLMRETNHSQKEVTGHQVQGKTLFFDFSDFKLFVVSTKVNMY